MIHRPDWPAKCAAGIFLALVLLSAARAGAADVPPEVLKSQSERVAVIAEALKSAVSIFGPGGQGGGSGVVITPDGYALTNFHVAHPVGNAMKCGLSDGRLYDAVIVGVDPTGDVALIKLLGRDDFPAAELGNSDLVRAGDWCFAVGNPFLLATDFQPTVTHGIVSGVHRYQYPAGTLLEYTDCIQTDAAINPGNSGGPLFDSAGRLIGVNGRGSFEKRGRVNVGVGYAISINQVKNFLGYLRSGRIVDHATLGATVSTDETDGAVVTNMLPNSDTLRRGLSYGDRIVRFGGRKIRTANGFKNVLGTFPKGWRVSLTYERDGEPHERLVRLVGMHARQELLMQVQRPIAPPDDPKRKPDEEPTPDQKPKRPRPIPLMPHQAPMPQHVAKLFEARPGYANFYFNRLNRDRVWNAFAAKGDFSKVAGPWTLAGELAGHGRIEIVLGTGDALAVATLAESTARIEPDKELNTQLAPDGSGGLLLAMHLWKRLSTLGPGSYGEVFYLGTAPMPGHDELVDVLVATHGAVESRFMFDSQSGHLVGLEMYPEIEVDPCEIYFSDYRDMDGRQMPHRLEVRYGNDEFGVITLKELQLAAPQKEEA